MKLCHLDRLIELGAEGGIAVLTPPSGMAQSYTGSHTPHMVNTTTATIQRCP